MNILIENGKSIAYFTSDETLVTNLFHIEDKDINIGINEDETMTLSLAPGGPANTDIDLGRGVTGILGGGLMKKTSPTNITQ